MRLRTRLILPLVVLLALALPAHAEPQRVGYVRVDLISEMTTIQPGQPFWVGLHLVMDKDWHVYWRNPGDSGLAPSLKWTLPEGFSAGEIQWPLPERIDLGPLTSYGYSDSVFLPIEITPPATLVAGDTVTLAAKASWLVCKESCLPGDAELTLVLPVAAEPPTPREPYPNLFFSARVDLPVDGSHIEVTGTLNDQAIVFQFNGRVQEGEVFFPFDAGVIDHAAHQRVRGNTLTIPRSPIATEAPTEVRGILISPPGPDVSGIQGYEITVPLPPATAAGAAPPPVSGMGILQAIFFAFLGGIILNLMPCVLPVLSLKVFGFIQQAGESRQKTIHHGLIFTLGVLISFWVLAGILVALRAGGEELGWGFQLQSPTFILLLASFMFLFGLNLLGVFEIGASVTGLAGQHQGKEGEFGSFVNGITATLVATPCTAPFMGAALGFSLSQPTWVIWLIFTALGLGMATPYLVLSLSPGLMKHVPKPGAWMQTFKEVMGFLLLATVLWLGQVLSQQAGAPGLMALLGTLLVLAFAAWLYGRFGAPTVPLKLRTTSTALAAVILIGGLAGGTWAASMAMRTEGPAVWEPFSPARVAELRGAGTPVLIDFTAAWCLTCQVNERVALNSAPVQARFKELGVVLLKADWTARDDTITQALAAYGRNSVPVYVLLSGEDHATELLLPEILTPGIVLEALESLDSGPEG